MPSGAVSIFFTLFVGYGIRKQSHRWAWIIACLIPAYASSLDPGAIQTTVADSCRILGGALMSFLPTSNKSGILAGIYLVNAVVAPLAVFYNVSVSDRSMLLVTCLTDSMFAVDGCQLWRCDETGLCGRRHQRLLFHRKHHRASDIPGPRQARVSACKTRSHGDSGWLRPHHSSSLLLLPVAEQEAAESCR